MPRRGIACRVGDFIRSTVPYGGSTRPHRLSMPCRQGQRVVSSPCALQAASAVTFCKRRRQHAPDEANAARDTIFDWL